MFEKRFNEYIDSLAAASKIKEAMKYTFLLGGKRFRILLFEAVLKDLECDFKKNIDVAIAIEMIHTYSLIHDDLPAMDNDDLRRGKSTNHLVYGEDIAILAGDALLTHAFDILINSELSDAMKVDLVQNFTKEAGVNFGMINGQVLDIQNDLKVDITVEELKILHLQKTASLIRLALICGIIAADRKDLIDTMEQLGNKLGLYYQIQDDYLDLYGVQEEMGKNINSDRENGKITYVDFFSKIELQSEMLRLEEEMLGMCENFANVKDIIIRIVNRRS